jgi:hypothetical protein
MVELEEQANMAQNPLRKDPSLHKIHLKGHVPLMNECGVRRTLVLIRLSPICKANR